MKRCLAGFLLIALLLASLPALADGLGVSLPTGAIVATGATIYDNPYGMGKQIGQLPGGTEVLILQRLGDWVQVSSRISNMVGWTTTQFVTERRANPVYPGIVISQSVSIRTEQRTNAPLVATLKNGAIIDLLEEYNGWYTVSFWDNKAQTYKQGWARTDFIIANPQYVTTHQATYVYAMPDRAAKKVGQVISGTQLVVIGEWGDFWVVNLRSASGFIAKTDVNYVNAMY